MAVSGGALTVIPAQAGIQNPGSPRRIARAGAWIPAFAGMTVGDAGWIVCRQWAGFRGNGRFVMPGRGARPCAPTLNGRQRCMTDTPSHPGASRRPSPSGRGLGEGETPYAAQPPSAADRPAPPPFILRQAQDERLPTRHSHPSPAIPAPSRHSRPIPSFPRKRESTPRPRPLPRRLPRHSGAGRNPEPRFTPP